MSLFPRPEDTTALRGFLGLAQQLGTFVPDLSYMTEPLRLLLKKEAAWLWLDEHQKAFDKVKKALCSELTLVTFDPERETELLTDASRLHGIGFALVQKYAENKKLVHCGSRSHSSAETKYATVELEALAIRYAVEKCKFYLQGMPCLTVLTDHRPLIGAFEKPLQNVNNAWLQRYREWLAPYSFVLKWVPGTVHVVADALSRAPAFDPPGAGGGGGRGLQGGSPR